MTVTKRIQTVLGLEGSQFSRNLARAGQDLERFHDENARQAKRAAVAMAGVAGIAVLIGKEIRKAFQQIPEVEAFRKQFDEVGAGITRVLGRALGPELQKATTWLRENMDAIVRVFSDFLDLVGRVLDPVRRLVGLAAEHRDVTSGAVTAVALLSVQMWALASAQTAVNAVMSVNPIMAVAMAILTLVNVGIAAYVRAAGGWAEAIARVKYEFQGVWEYISFWSKSVDVTMRAVQDVFYNLGFAVGKAMIVISEALANPFRPDRIRAALTDAANAFSHVWDPMGDAYREEMDAIQREHHINLFAMREEYERTLAEIAKRREDAAAAAKGIPGKDEEKKGGGYKPTPLPAYLRPPTPDELFGKAPGFNADRPDLELVPKDAVTRGVDRIQEFAASARQVYRSMWESFLDTEMTGKERREALWTSTLQAFHGFIGDQISEVLLGEKTQAALKHLFEKEKTVAAATGAAARQGIAAGEIATSEVVTSQAATEAAAKINAAHAWIPFAGVALAAGFIGYMIASIRSTRAQKFALGGLVEGAPGPDRVPILASRGEFVMPASQTQRYLPLLEAMRSGQLGQGSGTTVHVHLPGSSVLLADDQRAVDRWARRIQRSLEIRPTYRPLPAGAA